MYLRLRKFISSFDYLIGSILLVPATFCNLYGEHNSKESTIFFVISTILFLKGATIDLILSIKKPPSVYQSSDRLSKEVSDLTKENNFKNKEYQSKLLSNNNTDNIDENIFNKIEIFDVNDEEKNQHQFYDFAKNEYSKFLNISAINPNSKKHLLHSFITFAYFLGSILYLLGSILLWPSFNAGNISIWIYRVGSCLYLSGSYTFYTDLSRPNKEKDHTNYIGYKLSMAGLMFYGYGSLSFMTGGVISEIGYPLYGARMALTGALFITLGASFSFCEAVRTI